MSQTAERAFQVVEHVARAPAPCGLAEVALASGLDKSTAARMLAYLERRTLVQRDVDSKRYSVGPGLVSLAAVVIGGSGLPAAAQTHLEQLRDECGETLSLHVRNGHERVCVAGAESRAVLRRVLTIGEPVALWIGPTGKTILAFMPAEEQAAVIGLARAQLDDDAAVEALVDTLKALGRRGYALAVGDRTPGVGAVSVPVYGPAGVVGAVTAAGPAERWTAARMRGFAARLQQAAREISARLGGAAP
jgi:IclR family transcriptional regulator, acetate operon repressor